MGQNWVQAEASQTDISLSTISQCVQSSCDPLHSHSVSSSTSLSSCTGYATLVEPRVSSTSGAKTEEDCLCTQVAELKGEVDESKDEAYLKLLEQKQLEVEALEAFNKVILKLLNFIFSTSSYNKSIHYSRWYHKLLLSRVKVLMVFGVLRKY